MVTFKYKAGDRVKLKDPYGFPEELKDLTLIIAIDNVPEGDDEYKPSYCVYVKGWDKGHNGYGDLADFRESLDKLKINYKDANHSFYFIAEEDLEEVIIVTPERRKTIHEMLENMKKIC
jgi:hypothetical protein